MIFLVIRVLCIIISLIVFCRALIALVVPRPTNRVAKVIFRLTDWLLAPLRRVIPPVGDYDLTPLIALMLLLLIVFVLP